MHLNRQVQLLGEYLARSTQDEDRQRSHSMASTTAVQGHQQPLMTPRSTFVMDTDRFQPQVYMRNGPGDKDSSYSSVPYPYMDNLNTPVNSIRREYTPRIIDINYTEGSNDKNWSSRNFPWTKDIEVMFFNNQYHALIMYAICFIRLLNSSAYSGQEQKGVWKPFFPPKSTRNNQCYNEWE